MLAHVRILAQFCQEWYNCCMDNLPIPALPSFSPSVEMLGSPTVQAAIAFLFFFLFLILIALSRRILHMSSMHGITAGLLIGAIIVLSIEGGFVWAVKNLLHGEKAPIIPENIKMVLSTGQRNVSQVLGVQTERQIPTAQSVVSDYNDLSKLDAALVKNSVCKPTEDKQGEIQ